VERYPGSGERLVSTPDDDEALLDVIRESPFTNAAEATVISNFPGSVKTTRRRLRAAGIRNYAAARKLRLIITQHKEARVGFALQHLVKFSHL
jgi:hypothetical protein